MTREMIMEEEVIHLPRKAPSYRIRMSRWQYVIAAIRGGYVHLDGSAVSPEFGIGLGGEYHATMRLEPDAGKVTVVTFGGGGASGGDPGDAGHVVVSSPASVLGGGGGSPGGGGILHYSRGGNGRNGDGTWPETDGQGCEHCGAYGGGGHGGGCPNASA
jgi:hypothetical protein